MVCSVYCLVPSPDDIDPLLGRLREAGIPSRDVMVVLRDEPLVVSAGEPSPASPPAPQWWSMPLTPAALWWVSFYAWPGVVRVEAPPDEGPVPHKVVSLASYRAARTATR
jgi:hypothetical protein